MQKAAKEKSSLLWFIALAMLTCAPSFASSVRDLPCENRVEIFLLEGQNRVGQQAFRTGKHVENYDSRLGVALESSVAPKGGMFSADNLRGVEKASAELIDSVGNRRVITWADEGTDALRYLDYRGAEAASLGIEDIILRRNPSKAAVLEEFLHGTQGRLGIIDRLGRQGAETHVKDFMIRHRRLLGIGDEDISILQKLIELGL